MNRRYILSAITIALFCAVTSQSRAADEIKPLAYEPLHAGPAVWLEEYWDVKPEKFDDFVRAYRTAVYSLARHVPGYRGYTFLTTVPDSSGAVDPPNPSYPVPHLGIFSDHVITPHLGLRLLGKIETDRSINVSNMFMRAHNVVIIHHLQNWSDYEKFRPALAKAYSEKNGGADYTEYLVKELYPYANNYWEAAFRLIKTGLIDDAARLKGSDADGYDLEPRTVNLRWARERWDLQPQNLNPWLEALERDVYAYESQVPNYHGITVVTSMQPSPAEARRTGYKNQILGGKDEFYVPQPGVLMDGVIRTDISINIAALEKKATNVMSLYNYPYPWNLSDTGIDGAIQAAYAKNHPGQDWRQLVRKNIFPLANNHWDENWRDVEDSFMPAPGP